MIEPNIFQIFPRFVLNDEDGYAICKALEAGYSYFLEKVDEGLKCVIDVDNMPEWRLDEMAWEYNCLYDADADVEIKRGWIRDAIANNRIHGTAEGVRQYLKIYFGESSIDELGNFEFNVNVSGIRSTENENWIRKAVAKAKNVRSVLNNIIYSGGESEATVKVGAGVAGINILVESRML